MRKLLSAISLINVSQIEMVPVGRNVISLYLIMNDAVEAPSCAISEGLKTQTAWWHDGGNSSLRSHNRVLFLESTCSSMAFTTQFKPDAQWPLMQWRHQASSTLTVTYHLGALLCHLDDLPTAPLKLNNQFLNFIKLNFIHHNITRNKSHLSLWQNGNKIDNHDNITNILLALSVSAYRQSKTCYCVNSEWHWYEYIDRQSPIIWPSESIDFWCHK